MKIELKYPLDQNVLLLAIEKLNNTLTIQDVIDFNTDFHLLVSPGDIHAALGRIAIAFHDGMKEAEHG